MSYRCAVCGGNHRKFETGKKCAEAAARRGAHARETGKYMPVSNLGKPPPSNAGDTKAYDIWATSPTRDAPVLETLEDIQFNNLESSYLVPNGHYYLDTEQWTPDGIHVWLRSFTTGRWKDVWFVTAYEQDGTPELMGVHSDREFVFAKILSSGPHACMVKYGRLFSRCGICNEELTEEEREGLAGHFECFDAAFHQAKNN